jgi:hypothetical protein
VPLGASEVAGRRGNVRERSVEVLVALRVVQPFFGVARAPKCMYVSPLGRS